MTKPDQKAEQPLDIFSTGTGMTPGISVIIPTYNSAAYITQAIDSVLAQGYAPCELIVVDDGSTDETEVVLKPYLNQVKYVRQENRGSAAARNRGMQLAQHQFILFLDADDLMLPNKLQQLSAVLRLQPGLGYVSSGWQQTDTDGQIVQTMEPWQGAPELNLDAWLQPRILRLGSVLFRRIWLQRVGGFDPTLRLAHGVDLMLRLSLADCAGTWLHEPTVQTRCSSCHAQHNVSALVTSTLHVLDKLFLHPALPERLQSEKSKIYFRTLLWLGWQAVVNDESATAVSTLGKSLKLAPRFNLVVPETIVVEWLFYFAKWNKEDGHNTPLPAAIWPIFQEAAPAVGMWPELQRLANWWQADQPDVVRRNITPTDLWHILQIGLDWEGNITELNVELMLTWWTQIWRLYAHERFDDAAAGWKNFRHMDQFRLLHLVRMGISMEPKALNSAVLSQLWQDALAHGLLVESGFDESAFFAALPQLRRPRVSVIVPVFNGAAHIVETVESVLAQVYTDFELIVVDDGSTDGTAELLRPYRGRLRLIQQENQGVSAARNHGLRLALGDFVLFLDGDDVLYRDKLKQQVALLEADYLLGAVHSGWRLVDEYGRPLRHIRPWGQIPELTLMEWLQWKPVFLGAMLFRRSWLRRIDGFRTDLHQAEDTDFLLRLSLAGCPMRWLKRITIDYRQHRSNVTQNGRRQAHDMAIVLDDFFSNEVLPPHIKALGPTVQQNTLIWLVWQLHHTDYPEEIVTYLRKAAVINSQHPPPILAQIWIIQLASYGRAEGMEITGLRTFYPHIHCALQLSAAVWPGIERRLDWWLENWQMLHEGQLGDLNNVQQMVYGAIYLEEAGHIRSAVEWMAWWLKIWRSFLPHHACGAGHEMASFQTKTIGEVVQLAKASIVYAPHKVAAWQILVFWRQAQASGLVRPSDRYRIVSLYLTYFGQALLGKQWGRAAVGLFNAVRFSYRPKALGLWFEFIWYGLRYWRNGRLGSQH